LADLSLTQLVVIGLVAFAIYLHRARLLAILSPPAAPAPYVPPVVTARVVETTIAPAATLIPNLADLLSLTHKTSEELAHLVAARRAADAMVAAKADIQYPGMYFARPAPPLAPSAGPPSPNA
jgi:hypothetical protein